MKYMRFFLLLIACQSCAYIDWERRYCSPPAMVVFAEDIPPDIQVAVREGMEYWNRMTNKRLFIDGGMTDWTYTARELMAMVPIMIKYDSTIEKAGACAVTKFRKFKCMHNVRVSFNVDCMSELSDEKKLTVARHELGHVLGLDHNRFANSVMKADVLTLPESYHPVEASWRELEELLIKYKKVENIKEVE